MRKPRSRQKHLSDFPCLNLSCHRTVFPRSLSEQPREPGLCGAHRGGASQGHPSNRNVCVSLGSSKETATPSPRSKEKKVQTPNQNTFRKTDKCAHNFCKYQ